MKTKRRKLAWSMPAKRDLESVYAFLMARNPVAAKSFASELRRIVRRLPAFPKTGAPLAGVPQRGEFRSIVLSHYRLIYRLGPEEIMIFRLWDCRQDPARLWENTTTRKKSESTARV